MSKTILVIDDERAIRDAFELTLADAGYDVVTAASGKEGLEKLQTISPDLILIDLKMPEMDGVSVLREVRARNADVPVYIVTAFRREFMQQLSSALSDGLSFEVASKPLNEEQILSVVAAAVKA